MALQTVAVGHETLYAAPGRATVDHTCPFHDSATEPTATQAAQTVTDTHEPRDRTRSR